MPMNSTTTRCERNDSQDDLPKNVKALVNDIKEIIQKVDEFQFQFRLAWKRNQSTPIRKETNEY